MVVLETSCQNSFQYRGGGNGGEKGCSWAALLAKPELCCWSEVQQTRYVPTSFNWPSSIMVPGAPRFDFFWKNSKPWGSGTIIAFGSWKKLKYNRACVTLGSPWCHCASLKQVFHIPVTRKTAWEQPGGDFGRLESAILLNYWSSRGCVRGHMSWNVFFAYVFLFPGKRRMAWVLVELGPCV